MTTRVDYAVTEVITEPDPPTEGSEGGNDKRWTEQFRVEAILQRGERLRQRLSARGFDD